MRPISTSTAGLASRSFMSGIRLCPPASSLASPVGAQQLNGFGHRTGPVIIKLWGVHGFSSLTFLA